MSLWSVQSKFDATFAVGRMRRLLLSFVTMGTAALAVADSANAQIDPVEVAVGAFVAGGAAIGVHINKSEAEFLKPLVRCVADGRRVIDCPKNLLIAQLPREAQTFVRCVADGQRVDVCGRSEVFKQLPQDSRRFAECLVQEKDPVECGRKYASSQAERAAVGVIEKMKAETKNGLGEVVTPLQNIVRLVDAIARDDWEQVALNGGKAMSKLVIHAVLSTLLTQAGKYVASPVVDAIVEARADLAIDLIKALKAGDGPRIVTVMAEAYLAANFVVPCSLLPDGAVHEAVCGAASKIIGAVGKAAGAVTEALIDAIKDPLSAPGDLKDLISRTITGKDKYCGPVERVYAQNLSICYNRAAYLKLTDPAEFARFEEAIIQTGCRNEFRKCNVIDTVDRICNPVRTMFNQHAEQIAQGLTQAAEMYTRTFRSYMDTNGFACDRDTYRTGIDRFVGECESALQKQIPLSGDATWANCRPGGGQFSATNTAARVACRKAVSKVALNPDNVTDDMSAAASAYANSFRWYAEMYKERICKPNGFLPEVSNFLSLCEGSLQQTHSQCGAAPARKAACARAMETVEPSPRQVVAEVCAQPSEEPPQRTRQCFDGMVPTAAGGCACPAGREFRGRRCVLVSGPPPAVEPPPFVPPAVMPPSDPPPAPKVVRCTDGMIPTGDGSCRCPPGTFFRAGRCMRVAGPPPLPPPPIPTRPTGVRCPDGSQAAEFALCPKRCPDGRVVLQRDACPVVQPMPTRPTGVRCPGGAQAPEFALCPKRCPDGRVVLQREVCPVQVQPTPRPTPAPCPAGYRTLATPNKYGSYCELIPVATQPQPLPEARRCPLGTVGVYPRCRRLPTCGKGMEGTPPNCFPIIK